MKKVLLLNASYEPLNICSWKRAVVLILKGKAEEVEPSLALVEASCTEYPHVIRLRYYIKIPQKEIPLTRRNLMHRDHYRCQYCGKTSDLTIDHVIPRSRGGKDSWDNVVVACLTCNVTKGNRTPIEAGLILKKKLCSPFNFLQFELSKHRQINLMDYEVWKKYLFHAPNEDSGDEPAERYGS